MNNEITIKTDNLPSSTISSLGTIQNERELLINAYEDVIGLEITEDNIQVFKELRIQIRDNRTKGIEPWHKTNKAVSLAIGRTIDAIKNREVEINKRMEEKLLGAEKHFENLEKERIEKLNSERIELVRPYLEDVDHLTLWDMEDDVFQSYLEIKKRNFKAIQEEEIRFEKERLAKIKAKEEENNRIRIENERLRKEAEEKESLRLKEEAKRKALEEKERIEREKLLAIERKKQEEILLKARKEREILESKLKEKEEAERVVRLKELERLKAEEKEALRISKAPIKEQMTNWVNDFEIERSQIDNDLSLEIMQKFTSFKNWAKKEIEKI